MARLHRITWLSSVLVLASCAAPKHTDGTASDASPEARIQAIPAADPAKYRTKQEMKNWRNPYLIVRTDGVGLLDLANNEEHILKPDELLPALAKLPPSAWPDGRVVLISEQGIRNGPNDDVLIRKNRAIVAGTLESVHVLINWVPSP
jgi:hypothetical protein